VNLLLERSILRHNTNFPDREPQIREAARNEHGEEMPEILNRRWNGSSV
jgi:hypothetical protein